MAWPESIHDKVKKVLPGPLSFLNYLRRKGGIYVPTSHWVAQVVDGTPVTPLLHCP